MDLSGQKAEVTLTQSGQEVGAEATVKVVLSTDSISGFLDSVVPSTASSTSTFRLEVVPTWSPPAVAGTCS